MSVRLFGPPKQGTTRSYTDWVTRRWRRVRKMDGNTSKYMPHQGKEECRRRREKMKTGEYTEWIVPVDIS